jgi:hypothetical protein
LSVSCPFERTEQTQHTTKTQQTKQTHRQQEDRERRERRDDEDIERDDWWNVLGFSPFGKTLEFSLADDLLGSL